MSYTPDKHMDEVVHWIKSDAPNHLRHPGIKNAKAIRVRALKSDAQKIKKTLISEIGKCEICGFDYKPILQIHHIVPISEYGNNQQDNIICVCPNCHKTLHHIYSVFNGEKGEYIDSLKSAYGTNVYKTMIEVLLRYITKKGEIFGYFESVGLIPTSEE